MKLVIISLDLIVALPVLSVAALLLFSSIRGTQGYLLSLGNSESARLNALVVSQQIAEKIDASAANYSTAVRIAGSTSAAYNISRSLLAYSGPSPCGGARTVCRLVTISGNAYLLVLNYESPS